MAFKEKENELRGKEKDVKRLTQENDKIRDTLEKQLLIVENQKAQIEYR